MRQVPPKARMLGIAALTAGAIAAGIGGVAVAADSGGPATPTPSTPGGTASPKPGEPDAGPGPGDERRGHRRHGGPGTLGGLGKVGGGALHGEFVTPKAGGGYQTVRTQRGEVTAVSSTSITLESEDGFTAAYTVTADTLVNAARDGIATIKTGETAAVVAVVEGDKATAVRIVDLSRVKTMRDRFMPDRWDKGPRGGDGQATPTPTPSGSTRSSGFTSAMGI